MKENLFYQCKNCKTVLLGMCGGEPKCCSSEIEALSPNSVEAATEKHIPVVRFENGKLHVKVGSVTHPMIEEHYIMWIYVQTRTGGMFHHLSPNDAPEAVFPVEERDVISVYEYCNIHGLWVAEVNQE